MRYARYDDDRVLRFDTEVAGWLADAAEHDGVAGAGEECHGEQQRANGQNIDVF